MVNLVIVSHSARLGEGVGELARQMLTGDGCKLAIAAGIDDPENPIGTDPIKVMEAIESVADTDHVLVMMDIGSALLSAETALDLLDPAIAAKVRLCAAPLVEGTLAATVSAATGSDIDKVIADAMNALEAKRVQLGLPSLAQNGPEATPLTDDLSGESVSVVIKTITAYTFVRHRGWWPRYPDSMPIWCWRKAANASHRTALTRLPCCRYAATIH